MQQRQYEYVGPTEIRERFVVLGVRGVAIRSIDDLTPFAKLGEPVTFIVDLEGTLRVAPRRSEHVACAGGERVLSAGELTATLGSEGVVEISNQSTGYCPEPESWPAVAAALDRAGVPHPGRFTYEAIFRLCPKCNQRNLVKEEWFVCALCDADLPRAWNFTTALRSPASRG